MPIDYGNYPPDWKQISQRIRFERAKGHCEWCGLEHGAHILRSALNPERYLILGDDFIHYMPDGSPVRSSEVPAEYERDKCTRIVLTVHHKGVPKPDGTPGDRNDKMDCREENLVALCQRCHLLADLDIRIKNARHTRFYRKWVRAGQMELFNE